MRIIIILFALLILVQNDCFSQNYNDVRKGQVIFKEALNDLENEDPVEFENKLLQALILRPNHPSLMLNYAYALTLNKAFDEALKILNKIADMGVFYDLTNMQEFSTLKKKNGYQKTLKKFSNNLVPKGSSELIFELPLKDLLIEGIALEESDSLYFFSSVHKKMVIGYSFDGQVEFTTKFNLSPLGIKIDSTNENIWVSMAGVEQGLNTDKDHIGSSGIALLDYKTGKIKKEYVFRKDSLNHLFGDLLLSEDNIIYLSDSISGIIFKFQTELGKLEPVTESRSLISPQGLTFSKDKGKLIVADYSVGLVGIDRNNGKVNTIKNNTDTTLLGIDGIYRYKQDIIAVQNGIHPNRILKLNLDSNESSVVSYEVLLSNDSKLDDPTLGMVVEDKFYVNANSQWNKFTSGFNSSKEKTSPMILSISLK